MFLLSLPARGAWIEIIGEGGDLVWMQVAPREGSVDRNARFARLERPLERSLPARGAWIEIKSIFREATRLGTPHGEHQSAGPQSSSIDEEAV